MPAEYSPVIPECEFNFDNIILILLCVLCMLGGLGLGLKFRQVICKTCQPIIHNIHRLYPLQIVEKKEEFNINASGVEEEKEVEKVVEKVIEKVEEENLKKSD